MLMEEFWRKFHLDFGRILHALYSLLVFHPIYIEIGTLTMLECFVTSIPPANVTWWMQTADGVIQSLEMNSTAYTPSWRMHTPLPIEYFRAHLAQWRRASNIDLFGPLDKTDATGQGGSLATQGNSLATQVWDSLSSGDMAVHRMHTLRIFSVSQKDFFVKFICEARNPFGVNRTSISLVKGQYDGKSQLSSYFPFNFHTLFPFHKLAETSFSFSYTCRNFVAWNTIAFLLPA